MSMQHPPSDQSAFAPPGPVRAGTLSPDQRWRWDGAAWQPVEQRSEPSRATRGLSSWAASLDSVTSDDLYYGQTVIVWARWILIATGLLLSFWNPSGLGTLQIQLLAIIALAFGNFYLHVQLLRGHPSIDNVVYLASLADIGVVTALVGTQGGFAAPVYVFYFAAILGLSVAFPTVLTVVFTAGTVLVYFLVCAATSTDYPEIFIRLLTLAGIAVCGNLFARNERALRDDAVQAHAEAGR